LVRWDYLGPLIVGEDAPARCGMPVFFSSMAVTSDLLARPHAGLLPGGDYRQASLEPRGSNWGGDLAPQVMRDAAGRQIMFRMVGA
jgi:hypothetical protein